MANNNKILPIVISYNDLFRKITNISCSSLKNSNIHVHLNILSERFPIHGFQTESWYYCLTEKIKFAKKIFDSLENEECLIVADSDIIYFDSDQVYELKSTLSYNDVDFLAPMENYPLEYNSLKNKELVNCGFFIIKKTDKTKDIFNYVLSYDLSKYYYAEQDLINRFIKQQKINYQLLDPKKFILGCHIDCFSKEELSHAVMLHTTCANTLWDKIAQIINFRKKFDLPHSGWYNSELTKKEITHYIDGSIIFDQ